MKKLIYTLLFVLISVAANGQQAKYVFYFIGDGMGVNQVNGTEMYQAELAQDRLRTKVVEVVKETRKMVDLIGADIVVSEDAVSARM